MKNRWLLIIVLLIASAMRLWNLGNNPPHLTPDEASLGYNAYSIMKTGRDMHGETFPTIMKSFGDYTPALYVYLTIPFIWAFGLSEFSVRLVGALSGIANVCLIYLLTKQIFEKELLKQYRYFPLIATFLSAINPWLIHFSRGAWVPNLSLCITLAGILFFLKSLEKYKYLYFSSAFFALTLLAYQGAKITTIITIFTLVLAFKEKIKKIPLNAVLGPFFLGIFISLPVIISIYQGKAGRLDVISIFSYPRSQESINHILEHGEEKSVSISYFLFHSENLNFVRAILGRYFNHFSGRFLFFEGDWEHPRHSSPYMGMFLFIDFLFIIAGLYALIISYEKNKKGLIFILLWLLLAPLPSALTRDQVHAVRSLHLAIPLIIMSSLGLAFICNVLFQKGIFKKMLLGIFLFLYGLNYLYYLDSYFIHMPMHNAKYWDYGYEQVVKEVLPVRKNYKRIIVRQSYEQPFIYFLFYGASSDPIFSHPENIVDDISFSDSEVGDVGLVNSVDNIYFLPISWPIGGMNKGDLTVIDGVTVTREMIGKDYKIISEIKYPDKINTAYWILAKL